MRILILGSASAGAIENFYLKELRERGCDVQIFDPSAFVANDSLTTKVLRRLGSMGIYSGANREIIKKCQSFSPAVAWFFKGVELLPETIRELQSRGICVANYNPDHPFIRTSLTHGGRNVAECVPLYDIYFSYSRDLVQSLDTSSYWLPFGYHLPNDLFENARHEREITKACFLGTVDAPRYKLLSELDRRGVPLDLFGPENRFTRKLQKLGISIHPTIFENEFWSVIRAYRVQLNFFRAHNVGSHNQRSFEVPAAGGILLTPDSPEQREFFREDEEICFYKTLEELVASTKQLLQMDKKQATRIRNTARHRSLTSGYSYSDRASYVHDIFLKHRK